MYKKIALFTLSFLTISQNNIINAMADKETQTIPTLHQQVILSPLAWLKDLSKNSPSPESIQESFNHTFKLICLSISQHNNPALSREWLENHTTKAEIESYIQQIHESINQDYSQRRQQLIASMGYPLSLPHERMSRIIEAEHAAGSYYWTCEQSLNQARKELNQKLVILIKFLETAQTSAQKGSHTPSADSLVTYVEQELYGWRAFFKGCTIL